MAVNVISMSEVYGSSQECIDTQASPRRGYAKAFLRNMANKVLSAIQLSVFASYGVWG